MTTEDILIEREKTHGSFKDFADMRVAAGDILGYAKNNKLNAMQKVSIAMVLTKLCRILVGDPNFADHWDDISGYAMLGKTWSSTSGIMLALDPSYGTSAKMLTGASSTDSIDEQNSAAESEYFWCIGCDRWMKGKAASFVVDADGTKLYNCHSCDQFCA